MRFLTFKAKVPGAKRQFGFRIGDDWVVDVERGTSAQLAQSMPSAKAREIARALTPSEAVSFIAGGDLALAAARETMAFVEKAIADDAAAAVGDFVFRSADVDIEPAIPNCGKFIAAGKNFVEHLAEMTSMDNPQRPVAFAQFNTTVVGQDRTIPLPPETQKLDYEVEVAIVIGKPAYRVRRDDAMEYVFGFTIFNDLSARDLYRAEQGAGIPLLGKNLANCAPLGPHIVTRDEFKDPSSIALSMKVNGETRQSSTLKNMLYDIPELVSWWSQIGLEPGDILSSGTPSGVAAGRKPGQTPWWIKPGDVTEAIVDGIGVLRTTFA